MNRKGFFEKEKKAIIILQLILNVKEKKSYFILTSCMFLIQMFSKLNYGYLDSYVLASFEV